MMRFSTLTLAMKSATRDRLRTALSVAGVTVALFTFILLRTTLRAWTDSADAAPLDRLVTVNKVTFLLPLPKRAFDRMKTLPQLRTTSYANWFGGKAVGHEREYFGTLAVDAEHYFDACDELAVSPADLRAWQKNPRGAIVGEVIADKLGWRIGDRVTLRSPSLGVDLDLQIIARYSPRRDGVDRSQVLFHWEYLNEVEPARFRDQIGWMVSRAQRSGETAAAARAIDQLFEHEDAQTSTMDERASNEEYLGMVAAVFKAFDVISVIVLVILILVVGSTIAIGVRERLSEYAVLRALGFGRRRVFVCIMAESATICVLGATLAAAGAYAFILGGLGHVIESRFGSYLPSYRIALSTIALTFLVAIVVAALAALIPARMAARLDVSAALRSA
jgi:putative ABC transport system permease protein